MPYHKDASTVNTTTNASEYRDRRYICKWCKVQVMSKTDHSAVLGHEHKKSCPRRKNGR